jgi:hypothetical protein
VGDGDTAVSFDGTATALEVGTAFGFPDLAPFSFEAWIQPSAVPATHLHPFSKDFIDGNGRRHGWGVYVHGTAGVGLERFVDNVNYVVNGPVPAIDTYTYVVGTYDGAALRLYMDAVMVGASVNDTRPTIVNNATAYVGSAGVYAKVFRGVIDEVAIYDKALSADTIAAHFTAAK